MFDRLNSNDYDLAVTHTQPLLETHIVDKGDIFYTKGRNLAKTVYKKVWNTNNLVDGNDYGVVVSHNGNVLGNMNVQLRQKNKLLKSETFFCREHWRDYFQAEDTNVAEVSALAIAPDAPAELRRPIMMMLITGVVSLCRLEGIEFLVTVQHAYLIRILTKSLHIPFFPNTKIEEPTGSLPLDNYWQREKAPAIYYSEPLSTEVTDACSSFFFYLNTSGVRTAFYPRIKNKGKLDFSSFRKSWKQRKVTKLVPECV